MWLYILPILCPKIKLEAISIVQRLSFSNKSTTDFWYYLRNIKENLDDPKFGKVSDLIMRFIVLPHSSASVERIF